MTIAACLKWVDSRPDVDPLTGEVRTDPRTSAASDADEAALEWALRLGAERGAPVVALTAGPPAADVVLRAALAAGANSAIRVDMDISAPSDVVASGLDAAMPSDVDVVLCGVWSIDRGSASVPAFIAARRDAAQALGLVSLCLADDRVLAERRLDRGRRERLAISLPAVLSVEGGSARLRRAPLAGVLRARDVPSTVIAGPIGGAPPARTSPFRPRARELPAPPATLSARERALALTGALVDRTPPQQLVLAPPEAAEEILEHLRTWGYL